MANSNRRTNRGDNNRNGAPRWVVFMGGVATGVIATVVSGALIWPRAVAPSSSLASNEALGQATQREAAIKFEFDPMLRDSEVPVPAGDTPVSATIDAAAPSRVLLQAGAFRTRGDAENLRASLMLLDLGQVSTREALMKNGEVWFRVFVGPFANDAAQHTAKDKLAKQNISPLIVAAPADMPNEAPRAALPPATGPRANTPAPPTRSTTAQAPQVATPAGASSPTPKPTANAAPVVDRSAEASVASSRTP